MSEKAKADGLNPAKLKAHPAILPMLKKCSHIREIRTDDGSVIPVCVCDCQIDEKGLRLATLVRQSLEHIAKHGQITELTLEFSRAGAS